MSKLKVSLAQIKVVTGDLLGNTEKIITAIQKAENEMSDIVVFPEMCITGYACGDLFLHNGFISHQLEFLEKKIIPFTKDKHVTVVIGFADRYGKDKDGFPHLKNSCNIIKNGKSEDVYDKILLAKRGQHDDVRYFEPGKYVTVCELTNRAGEKVKWSPLICQDIWNDESMIDTVKLCKDAGAEIIISINQSYFYFGKQAKRMRLVSDHCVDKNIHMVYVNSVGVGDITKNVIIYDGQSFVCNNKGEVTNQLKLLSEDFWTIEIDTKKAKVIELANLAKRKLNESKTRQEICDYVLTKEQKYRQIYSSLKFCVREFFNVSGIKKAMVYLSGGIDSSVVATIVSEAFEKENIVFISSPTEDNGEISKSNAQKLADNLEIKLHWVSMQKAYDGFINDYKDAFNEEPSSRSKSAYQAIGRTPQSIGICHRFGNIANVGCSNQTENILGFSSLNDIANTSAIGLINDLTKIEVYELAEFINDFLCEKEVIPVDLYNGQTKPSAELADNKSEDPYNYELYAPLCSVLIRYQMDASEIVNQFKNKSLDSNEFQIWKNGKSIYENVSLDEFEKAVWNVFDLSKKSVYKSAQAGPTPIISPFSRGFSSRETLLNRYSGKYEVGAPVKQIELEIKKLHVHSKIG